VDLRDKLDLQRAEQLREQMTYTIENEQAQVLPDVQVQIVNDRSSVRDPVDPKNLLTKIEGENFCLRCNSKRCAHCEELDYEYASEDEAMDEALSFVEGEEGGDESENE
jgi:hypothetical protein